MSETVSQQRWAANEVVFRKANQRIYRGLKKLKADLDREGRSTLVRDTDMPIYFVCECADEGCTQRVLLRPSVYEHLHKNSSQFVIKPGHMVASIEREVDRTPEYIVVEKFMTPPPSATTLSPTPIRNT